MGHDSSGQLNPAPETPTQRGALKRGHGFDGPTSKIWIEVAMGTEECVLGLHRGSNVVCFGYDCMTCSLLVEFVSG